MRRRYLRFKKWVLLKMIYALAAVLRFLKRQVPGGEARAYRRATGRDDLPCVTLAAYHARVESGAVRGARPSLAD